MDLESYLKFIWEYGYFLKLMFFISKYIKIIFFYFLKIILEISASKRSKK
jgi:hypothetical protein